MYKLQRSFLVCKKIRRYYNPYISRMIICPHHSLPLEKDLGGCPHQVFCYAYCVGWGEGGSNSSQSSDGLSYDWVDPFVLKIPTKFRDSNTLDQFLFETSFAWMPLDLIVSRIAIQKT